MSEQTFHLVQAIRQRLHAVIRRITLADLAAGLLLTLGIVSAIWLISAAVEAGFWLETTSRAVLFWAIALTALGLALYFLVLPLLRLAGWLPGPSEESVAARIGARYPEVSDRLVNLLHLAEGRRSDAPDPLVDGAVRMLGEQVQTVPFEQVEDFHRARRAGRLASVPIVGLLLFVLAAPQTFLDASTRLFSPGVEFARPAPFAFSIEPGHVELVRGQPLEIVVRTKGREQPRTLTLALNNLDEELVEEVTVTPDSAGVFRHTVVNVRRSLRYRATAETVTSLWYTAAVTERPLVRNLQVALAFPRYTGIPPQRLEPNVGDVTALPGTDVSLDVGLGGRDVIDAFVAFDDGTLDTLQIDGSMAMGSFTLQRAGTYRIVLRNASGVANSDPITYSLTLLSDAAPTIVMLDPEPTTDLNETLRTGLRLRLNDDFGFSRLRLYYRLAESRFDTPMDDFAALPLPLSDPGLLNQEVLYDWLVTQDTGLDPVPGDVIEYFVRVWDNDAVAGYKAAQSATQRLRLPSLAEQYEQLEATQEETASEMEALLQETQSIREQFEELRDELRSKQEADWEDQRQLEQLQERQKQLESRVEALSDEMQSMTEQMKENDLVSDETLEMYEELQKVAEEINSPELQDALRELQQAMEDLNLQQLQEAIGDYEFNEQQYRERLERTLDLFKKLRVQQGLEEAARRAEELARQQERLAEETRKLMAEKPETRRPEAQEEPGQRPEETPNEQAESPDEQNEARQNPQDTAEQGPPEKQDPSDENQNPSERREDTDRPPSSPQQQNEQLAKEQQQSSEEMEALEQQLQQLQKQMDEMRNTPGRMQQQLQQMQEQQLQQQMQQNSQQLQQMQLDQAQKGQQQMQQQLQQMSQQLQQMQQQMQGQQMQMNRSGLRRALEDVLTLSQQQEQLRQGVRGLSSDSPQLREMAQQQVELAEGLSVVSDSLQQLARQIPQMNREVQNQTGSALREMGAATEAMADRIANRASGHQQGAMMHLNELALMLSELLNQMMNAGGQGGSMSLQQMIQQLQQMAGQQQQLNNQLQEFLNDVQGNRLSSDMQQRLRQMSEQQDALRRQLKQMSRDPNARGKLLGDLNKIADQMQETIEELQRGRTDRRTVERQRQILTRLLDAQKSLRERGQDKKRESQSGREIDRTGPDQLTPSEQADQLRRDLIRALDSGYAPDYEELIKRYFELLQQQQSQP